MSLVLQGKVALVTGASRGIGRAIAIALVQEKMHVVLVARTETDLQATQALCAPFGTRIIPIA